MTFSSLVPARFARQCLRVARLLTLTLGAAACCMAWSQTAPKSAPGAEAPIPVESFFSRPAMSSARLSPSGRYVSMLVAPKGTNVSLAIFDTQSANPPKVIAAFEQSDVFNVRWVNDDLLLFSLASVRPGRAGERQPLPGLLSIQRSGEGLRELVKRNVTTMFPTASGTLEGNHGFLAMAGEGTDEVILGQYLFGPDYEVKSISPIVLNARTGARRSLLKGDVPADVRQWLFDRTGNARLGASASKGRTSLHWHELSTGKWRVIAEFDELDPPFSPVHVDRDGTLYVQVARDPEGSAELRKFDFTTGKPGDEVMAVTPGFDGAIDVVEDRRSGTVLGYSVLTDAWTQVWTTPQLKKLQAHIDGFLQGRVNLISCARCSDPDIVLVNSYSDRMPGEWLLYRPKDDSWVRLGTARPDIPPSRMASVGLDRIKARDGHELPVWITGAPARGAAPKPAVVLVHGGPWVRGSEWGWDSTAQFLASRGYVVIEPEFRGSLGYGKAHFRAGWKQWGLAMQDDVSDALQFAVKQGWADPSRACIAGASYGGYATLMGVAKDPLLYRCGIAWVAVSDPRLLFSTFWDDVGTDARRYSLPQLIGDPKTDEARLAAVAPVEQAHRIKAPLLLAYGGMDRRVPIDHGRKMREALIKSGQQPEWVVYDDEGHGWRKDATNSDFWRRVERFLAQHLQAR